MYAMRNILEKDSAPPVDRPLLEMSGVDFHYPGRPNEWILRDASLVVREGERVGMTGANGSGKTTVPRLLLGQYRPRRGEVRLFGRPVSARHHYPGLAFVGDLSLVAGGTSLPADVPADRLLSAYEAIFAASPWGRPRAKELRAALGLDERRFAKPIAELSKGMRMRVQFFAALAKRPRLLVADEPTEGLDNASRDFLLGAVRRVADEEGMALLWITHRYEEVALLAARAYELRDGALREWGGELLDVSFAVNGRKAGYSVLPAAAVLNEFGRALSSRSSRHLALDVRRKGEDHDALR